MRALSLAVLAFAAVSTAHAQEGLTTGPDYDLIYSSDRVDDNRYSDLQQAYREGLAALQAKDYAQAEAKLEIVVKRQGAPMNTDFLMGLAKIGLEKWGEAQPFLEAAVQREPKRPEPKTRLGLTYIKLENAEAARGQRDALASLEADCNKTCSDAQWITEGVTLLDQALKAGAAVRVSADNLASVSAPPPGDPAASFDPTRYSLVTFENKEDLYELLTKPGRCEPNKTAERRQPCALILYRPLDGSPENRAANFKPVFKVVNRQSIWAIHDKKLQKVKIDDLYFDNVDLIGGKRTTYLSTALVGNAENASNCAGGKPCLAHLVQQDMFKMYGNMPDSVVEVVWGPTGMKDPGTVRVR